MRRSYLLYLEDILESAKNIQGYVGNLSFEELKKDRMRIDAIVSPPRLQPEAKK